LNPAAAGTRREKLQKEVYFGHQWYSTVVEQSTHDSTFVGSNPPNAGTKKEK
jgi:hypothetical protein